MLLSALQANPEWAKRSSNIHKLENSKNNPLNVSPEVIFFLLHSLMKNQNNTQSDNADSDESALISGITNFPTLFISSSDTDQKKEPSQVPVQPEVGSGIPRSVFESVGNFLFKKAEDARNKEPSKQILADAQSSSNLGQPEEVITNEGFVLVKAPPRLIKR